MAKQPVTMAVAGLGRAGWDIHVRAIRSRNDFKLVEVMDQDATRREEAKAEFGCDAYPDWKSLLKNSKAELVVVATQSQDHAWMSCQALAAGKHVLCEKPVATKSSDLEKVMTAAKKSKGLFTVHQSARFAPELLHIQEVVKSGKLGRIFNIQRNACGFSRRNDWQTFSKYGGGQLNNNGVHLIDQVLQVLNSPAVSVFGDLQQILNPGDVEDHVNVVFRTESGAVGEVQIAVCALSLPTWVVMGTKGSLISDGKTSKLRYLAGKLKPLKPIDSLAVAGRRYGTSTGEKLEFIEEEIPASATSKKNYYDYLYDSIRNKKPLFVTPESVYRTMQVLKLARKGTKFV